MPTWRNATGHALSSSAWLETHHLAKLPERTRFAQSLAQYRPNRLVDLGCGTGLWLDLFDKVLPPECEFIGLDSDPESLDLAGDRARYWTRKSNFILCDIVKDHAQIPQADLTLVFNLFPYLPNVAELLEHFRLNRKAGRIVIRQYDGGTMRIGPMSFDDRCIIESSLRASLEASAEPSHYTLDRAYDVARACGLMVERLEFELTQRHAPFPREFTDYFRGTMDWMNEFLSDDARARLHEVLNGRPSASESLYFSQVDLVAVLSAAR